MIPRRVRLATLLAFLLHGALVLTGQYSFSFDAYNHMFFGDHYRLEWWALWEPRWYTGFSITSYPPLVHQLIGLLGHLIGVDSAFALLLWGTLTAYPVAVYAFSRIFLGRSVSGYAALAAAVVPSLYLSGHAFGQLPTLTATLVALFGLVALANFLRHGGNLRGMLTISLFAMVMAAHHATLLFLPWAIIGLLLHLILVEKINKRLLLSRLAFFLPSAAAAGLLVIWPFWMWGRGQSIQTPIDHPSRHNFFYDYFAVQAFFLAMYGSLTPIIPSTLWHGLRPGRYLGLGVAFLPLFLLGLGDTTPLPRLLFRAGWEWLTYDRFALWASLMLLPFFGTAILKIQRGLPRHLSYKVRLRFPKIEIRRRKTDSWPPIPLGRPRRWVTTLIFFIMSVIALIAGCLATIIPFEPAKIDMKPIVGFLAEKNRSEWRYLTFGFGDQLAYLSRLTPATTIDGSYHTARNLPELRESGIGQIDTAYWMVNGLNALDPILQKSGEHGVRWGFVSVEAYVPVLKRNGWVRLTSFQNGIQVWENPSALKPLPTPHPPDDPLASFSWGVFPLFALTCATILSIISLFPGQTQKIAAPLTRIWPWVRKAAAHVHQLTLGMLPLALCFWYYQSLTRNPIEGIYLTYTDGLLFLSDFVALTAINAWFIADQPKFPALSRLKQYTLEICLTSVCLLASLSILWSIDWHISFFFSLHLWLVYGLFLAVRARPESWGAVAIGFCVALLLQILIGSAEFLTQTTTFLAPLNMTWPGLLDPSMRGASVVELADGTRWLRTYGTLPHPNVVGGFTLIFLAGPAAFFLLDEKRHPWALPLLTGGAALLILTFSRSAWLGLGVIGLVLALRVRRLPLKRLMAAGLATLTGLLITTLPLQQLIFTRGGVGAVATETFSNAGRVWLMEQAFRLIRDHPITGVGAGAFIVESALRTPYGYFVEPVHNLQLLVTAELGIPGALIGVGLGVLILRRVWRTTQPKAILFSALLLGLLTTSFFDHYLWTLAPGRMLLGLALGLWAAHTPRIKDTVLAKQP